MKLDGLLLDSLKTTVFLFAICNIKNIYIYIYIYIHTLIYTSDCHRHSEVLKKQKFIVQTFFMFLPEDKH